MIRPNIAFKSKLKYVNDIANTEESNKIVDIIDTIQKNKKAIDAIIKHDLMAIHTSIVAISKLSSVKGNTKPLKTDYILRALSPASLMEARSEPIYSHWRGTIKTIARHIEVFGSGRFLYDNLFSASWKARISYTQFQQMMVVYSDPSFDTDWGSLGPINQAYFANDVLLNDGSLDTLVEKFSEVFDTSTAQKQEMIEYYAGIQKFGQALKIDISSDNSLAIYSNRAYAEFGCEKSLDLIESLLSEIMHAPITVFGYTGRRGERLINKVLDKGADPTMNELTWLEFAYQFCAETLFDGDIDEFERWLAEKAIDSNFYNDISDNAYQVIALPTSKTNIHPYGSVTQSEAQAIIGARLTDLLRDMPIIPLIGSATTKKVKCLSWKEAWVPGAFAVSRNLANELIEVPNDIDGQVALLSNQDVGKIMRRYKADWTRPRASFDPYSATGLTTKRIEGDYVITWGRKFGTSGLKSVYIEIAGVDSVTYLYYKPLDLIFNHLKKGAPVITVVPDKMLTAEKARDLGVNIMTFKEYYQRRFEAAGAFIPVLTESELQMYGRAQSRAIDIVRNGEGFDSYFDWIQWLASSDRTGSELALMGLTSVQAQNLASCFGITASTTSLINLAPNIQFWFYCHQQSDQYQIHLPAVTETSDSIVCDPYMMSSWLIYNQNPPANMLSVNPFAFLAFHVYTDQILQWAIDQGLSPAIVQDGYLQIYSNYYQNQYHGESIGFGPDFWNFYAGNIFPKRFQN